MAINFTKSVRITPVDEAESAAARVDHALDRLFSGNSSFQEDLTFYGGRQWRLRDSEETTATGPSLQSVFSQFREHDLTPSRLSTTRAGTAGSDGSFTVSVYYFIDKGIVDLDVSSASRITLDGIAATCERIKISLEQPIAENSLAPSGALVAAVPGMTESSTAPVVLQPGTGDQPGETVQPPSDSWLARSWKDHTATFVVSVFAGVVVIVVALMLGLKP